MRITFRDKAPDSTAKSVLLNGKPVGWVIPFDEQSEFAHWRFVDGVDRNPILHCDITANTFEQMRSAIKDWYDDLRPKKPDDGSVERYLWHILGRKLTPAMVEEILRRVEDNKPDPERED